MEYQLLIDMLLMLLLSMDSLGLCCKLASALLAFWSNSTICKKLRIPSHRGRLKSVVHFWAAFYHL